MRDLFTPTDRALHQFGGFPDLRPIDEDAWARGLSERFVTDDCDVADTALTRLIEYSAHHAPALAQTRRESLQRPL